MLIDQFLPHYEIHARHEVSVRARIDRVYAAVRELDISDARLTHLLFRLRGIPADSRFTLDDLLKMRFTLLGETENEELLLGLVGRFWTLSGGLLRLDAEGYRSFDRAGYAKAAWNFSLAQQSNDTVLLATETRVHCTNDESRRRFKLYWRLIGTFSGLIRREILRALKKNATASHFSS